MSDQSNIVWHHGQSEKSDGLLFEITSHDLKLIQLCLYYTNELGSFGAPNHHMMTLISKLASPYFSPAYYYEGIDANNVDRDVVYEIVGKEGVTTIEYGSITYHDLESVKVRKK
jgi:hypothetical protein